jgi:lipopolysaccharide export system protein LptC
MTIRTSSTIEAELNVAVDRRAGGGGPRQGDMRAMRPADTAASSTAIRLRDRTVEFRLAKRHSARVRALKVLLPTLTAGILSLYIIPSLITLRVKVDGGKGEATVKSISIEAGSLKMINPHLQGVNETQGVYDVTADSARQDAKATEIMYLDNIRGKLTTQQGEHTILTAPNGVYNNKAEEMRFDNGALVTRDNGMTATFQTATVYMKLQKVISNTPVTVRLHDSKIDAQTMVLFTAEQRAIFEGNVKVHLERTPAETKAENGEKGR